MTASQIKPRIRAAIYTRKSTEEGLDQDFDSLDAQHEACAAYIASQRYEGWIPAKDRFDDGGISGGTLDRPALRDLLTEIEAGRIQMVVVYKIDRLTRSLADFAKLVERLDAAGCSFVSVTQAFNTASSMGRLTLNVLLSFAQFEREVTAERIRDKIAASKKRGLWMGGLPPLGYDPHPNPKTRGLVVNTTEAETVRTLFELYDTLGCFGDVAREAGRLGLRSKLHRFQSGRSQGGTPLSRGQIHKILTNPIYIGKIRHKGKVWDGQHAAIIGSDRWDRVQAKLIEGSARPRGRRSEAAASASPAPLTGKLRDETGDRLTPTHTKRRGRRIGYYFSHRLIAGSADPTGWRLPAKALERAIANVIADHLDERATSQRLCTDLDLASVDAEVRMVTEVTGHLRGGDTDLLHTLLLEGSVARDRITLVLGRTALATALEIPPDRLDLAALTIEAPFALRRRGAEAKLIVGDRQPDPDPVLIRALARAHGWAKRLRQGEALTSIAGSDGHTPAYLRTRMQLAFLSPRIQTAILDGTQPPELTLERIIRAPMPLDWACQEQRYRIPVGYPHP